MQRELHSSVRGRHGTGTQSLIRWFLGVLSALTYVILLKGKVNPLQARCVPEGGYRYSSTLPRPRH